LASLLIESDKNAEALGVLDRVIANAGETESARRARTRKATLLLADGQYEQAAEQVAAVLDDNPRDAEALLIRAGISMVTDVAS
jgi:Tfp pilus assembly protein PilF